MADDTLRLHIGGRETKDGWKILNVQPGQAVDYVGDCRDLSDFADASAAEIYVSHVLEHLGYLDELPETLAGFRRVLVAGGKLMISVPDFEVLCRLFLHPELDVEQRFTIMRMAFGGQTDAFDYHKVGLTFEFLEDYLTVAGFRDIERVDGFGLFDDDSTLEIGGGAISLNVAAAK